MNNKTMDAIKQNNRPSACGRGLRICAALLVGVSVIANTFASENEMNLMDLEWRAQPGDLERVFDVEKAKGGDESLRLDAGIKGNFICRFPGDRSDLSAFESLHFWAFSEADTYARLAIVFVSPNENDRGDYYITSFVVDWKGWKEFNIPWDNFEWARNPAGWDAITELQFITYQFSPPTPGTILYLSDIFLK